MTPLGSSETLSQLQFCTEVPGPQARHSSCRWRQSPVHCQPKMQQARKGRHRSFTATLCRTFGGAGQTDTVRNAGTDSRKWPVCSAGNIPQPAFRIQNLARRSVINDHMPLMCFRVKLPRIEISRKFKVFRKPSIQAVMQNPPRVVLRHFIIS